MPRRVIGIVCAIAETHGETLFRYSLKSNVIFLILRGPRCIVCCSKDVGRGQIVDRKNVSLETLQRTFKSVDNYIPYCVSCDVPMHEGEIFFFSLERGTSTLGARNEASRRTVSRSSVSSNSTTDLERFERCVSRACSNSCVSVSLVVLPWLLATPATNDNTGMMMLRAPPS